LISCMSRRTLEDEIALDIRPIVRSLMLIDLDVGGLAIRGERQGNQLVVMIDGAALSLRTESTAPHFGGSRWWALCPECGRRCAVLYIRASLPRALAGALSGVSDGGWSLVCRVCVGRPYASQGHGAIQARLARRVRAHEAAELPTAKTADGRRRWRWGRTRAALCLRASKAERELWSRALRALTRPRQEST
jgi:hypothetical protein